MKKTDIRFGYNKKHVKNRWESMVDWERTDRKQGGRGKSRELGTETTHFKLTEINKRVFKRVLKSSSRVFLKGWIATQQSWTGILGFIWLLCPFCQNLVAVRVLFYITWEPQMEAVLNGSPNLKTRDTIGNSQRLVFSLGVSQHMHKITKLWKFELNWSSELRGINERKNTLVTRRFRDLKF